MNIGPSNGSTDQQTSIELPALGCSNAYSPDVTSSLHIGQKVPHFVSQESIQVLWNSVNKIIDDKIVEEL